MANGLEKDRGIQGTLWKWAEDSKIESAPKPKGADAKDDGRQIVEFVFSHFEKFSPKIKKQIEVLQKSFRALGFSDDEAKAILSGDPKIGAKRLIERGQDFEKRSAAAKAEKKGEVAADHLEQAERAYRLAIGVDPKDASAHQALSAFLYQKGEIKSARDEAGLALRHADFKEVPKIIVWLQGMKDPEVKNSHAIQFAATQLIEAKRFDDAKNLFQAAARRLASEGDEAKAQKYFEKALVVEEMGGAYALAFNDKNHPELTKLYRALRAEGIPSGLMSGASVEKKGDKSIEATELLAYVDGNLKDPRVQHALKACGLANPKPRDKAEAAMSFSKRLSLQHQRQAESAGNAKQKERHLSAAASFEPTSASKAQVLAEFHLGHQHSGQAVAAYEELLRIAPGNVEGQRALAKLYLAEDRWESAYQVLPRPEAEALLIEKLGKARQFAEAQDWTSSEGITSRSWKLLENTYKGRASLSNDELGRILRLKANLDLTAGAIHALKEGEAHGVQGFRQTVEACNEAIQKNPKDVAAYLLRAQAQEKLGQDAAALSDYREAAKLSPDGVKSLPEEYLLFTDRYHDRLRASFQKELGDYKRFAYETGDAEQKKAGEARTKLEALVVAFKDYPAFSDTQRFEDLQLVRDFLKFRVQHQEAIGMIEFVGVKPEEVEFGTADKAKHLILNFGGLGGAKKLDETKRRLEAEIKRHEEHNAHLLTMGYATTKAQYETELKQMEEGMRELRNRLLPTLELKPGESSTLEQVTNAKLVCDINRELGHYSGLSNTLDQWKKLVDNLSPHQLDDKFRVEQYGQMVRDWKSIRALDADKYPSALPKHDEITDRILSLIGAGSSFSKIIEGYAKSQGIAWDAKVYNNLVNGIVVGDESQDTRLMNFLSSEGVKTLFDAHRQAEKLEQRAVIAYNQENWAEAQSLAMQALQLYGQTGNVDKIEEMIEYVDSQLSFVGKTNDVADIDKLHNYQAMAQALNGSGISVRGESNKTYEDKMLDEARRYAGRMMDGYVFGHASKLRDLVAARSFFEWDHDEASVQEADKKLLDGRKDLQEMVELRVSGLESKSEREAVSTGSELDLTYGVENRQGIITDAAAVMESDLALIGTYDLSKKEVREEVGNKLLRDLDLWKRSIAASPNIDPKFRMEQYRQLAATAALLGSKQFTEGDSAILRKTDTNPDDGILAKVESYKEARNAAWHGPSLEKQTQAIVEMGKALIEENSFAFYQGFPLEYQGVVQTIRSHQLSPRIEKGILGNYLEAGDDAAQRLNKDDWKEIEKIATVYRGDFALQDTMIESYLVKVGKFSAVDDGKSSVKEKVQADYITRFETAMKKGDAEFLAVMGPESFGNFRDAVLQGHEKMADSLNPELPKAERLEAALEAAAVFGQMGLEARTEEALAPVKAHVDSIEDPVKRATGYLSIAQVYEMAGMDAAAKGQLQKVVELDKPANADKGGKAIHEMSVFAKAKIQLGENNLDEAKKLLTEIQDNPMAKQILAQIDGAQFQQRVGYPMEFLTGVLLAEVDKRRGSNREDIKYHMETKDKADKFMIEAQSFLKEAQRLCANGECKSLQQAMERLRTQGSYFSVFSFLDSTGRGKDTLAYIKTMQNSALSDVQMAGETLRLAEKLLSRDDFDFAMKVSAGLLDDPFVSKQAKELVKNRIPDAAKWKARKEAIWKAVKDILIVPAIVEGRYGDAFISAVTTIASFGIGRIFSAGAKLAWAGMTARSVARVGWMARFAAYAPRAFKVGEVAVVAMADNAGFAVGGMLSESAITGTNQFSWNRFWHELAVGIAPFGMIHASGKVMQVIGKKAEHIPWLKIANEADAALLKAEGKLAITGAGRAGVWATHRMMNATAFTLGGIVNQKVGLIEEEKGPLALVFLQNMLTDLQMLAAHKGLNSATGGRMDKLDRKLDQELHLAPTLAKLKIGPKTEAGKAMTAFLQHYSETMSAQRGKPLSSADLVKEISALNDSALKIIEKTGVTDGNAFEAARSLLFMTATEKNMSADQFKAYAERIGKIPELDGVAAELLPKGSKGDRDMMKANLLFWAMDGLDHPLKVKERLAEFRAKAPEITKDLHRAVEGLLGPDAMTTERGKRMAEVFLVRALGSSKTGAEISKKVSGLAEYTKGLGKQIDGLLALAKLTDPKARLALVEWATTKNFDSEAFSQLQKEMERGEVALSFVDGKLGAGRVLPENQAEQRRKIETAKNEYQASRREQEAMDLGQEFKLSAKLSSKAQLDQFQAMVRAAAQGSKVSVARAKELFVKMLPAIQKNVDSLHRDGVRRAIFLEILGGKIGETRSNDLIARLEKGEITLEVGEFGKFAEVQRRPEDKKADAAENADTVVMLRDRKPAQAAKPDAADQGKEASPTQGDPSVKGSSSDNTAVQSPKARKPANDKPQAKEGEDKTAVLDGGAAQKRSADQAKPNSQADTAVLGPDKVKPAERADEIPAAAFSDAAPISERVPVPDLQFREVSAELRFQQDHTIAMIASYYGHDGVRAEMSTMAQRSDRWGKAAKRMQEDLALFDKAHREYMAAEKASSHPDSDPGVQQKFQALLGLAQKIHGSEYNGLEKKHIEMLKGLGEQLWPLENALASIQFAELGNNFSQSGKTTTSFEFDLNLSSLEKLANYDGDWASLSSQRLAAPEVKVDSWARAEEILQGLRQSKITTTVNGKKVAQYGLEIPGELSRHDDGKSGSVTVTVKGPPAHTLNLTFSLKEGAAKAETHDNTVIELRPRSHEMPVEPSAELYAVGRSGHDMGLYQPVFPSDYFETIATGDAKSSMNGGIVRPQLSDDPLPTKGSVWKVRSVKGEYLLLEEGKSFENGVERAIGERIMVKVAADSRFRAGDQVRIEVPVQAKEKQGSEPIQIFAPETGDTLLIGRDRRKSQVFLDGAEVSRQHATIKRGADGEWYLGDGYFDDKGVWKVSQNGVKTWDGSREVPVGRDNWHRLQDGQYIKIGQQWLVFHSKRMAVQPQMHSMETKSGVGADLATFLENRTYLSDHVELPGVKMTTQLRQQLKDAERVFEQGGQATELNGRILLIALESGAHTINSRGTTKEVLDFYNVWKSQRSFTEVDPATARQAWTELQTRAKSLGIKVTLGEYSGHSAESPRDQDILAQGAAIAYLNDLFKLLPDSMLANPRLREIALNVSRKGPGKLSSYDEHSNTAFIYSGAFTGTRQNMAALFFHELGHSTAERYAAGPEGDPSIPQPVRQRMNEAQAILAKSNAMLGLDWADGAKGRAGYQHTFVEFLAEMNMMYVTAGPKLRQHIESFSKGSKEREAWDFVYAEMRDRVFHGLEYGYSGAEAPRPTQPMSEVSPNHVADGPQDWSHVAQQLSDSHFAVDQVPGATRDFDVYVGDRSLMDDQYGPSLVISHAMSGEVPAYLGKFIRSGDDWVYAPNGQQAVYGSDLLPKKPNQDGTYKLEEGDLFTWGYKYFEFSQGKIRPRPDSAVDQMMPSEIGLHLPGEVPLAAFSSADGPRTEQHFAVPAFEVQMMQGAVDLSQPVPVQSTPATTGHGEYASAISQGVGYKNVNEDVSLSLRGPDGKLLLVDIDGMGGHAGGDDAAKLVAEAVAAEYPRSGSSDRALWLANQAVFRFNGALQEGHNRDDAMNIARGVIADPQLAGQGQGSKGSGAVAVMVEHIPPAHEGGDATLRFNWVGDARAMQVRADANGRLQWVYRTVDQGLAGELLQPGADYAPGGAGKTLAFQVFPHANVVTNSIGSSGNMATRGTQHGEVPDPSSPTGSRAVGDANANGIAVKPNDWVILGSDGFWENFGRTEVLLNVLDKAKTADEATRLLTDEVHWRMGILSQAKGGQLPHVGKGRFTFERPGGFYYLDNGGRWRKSATMEIDRSGKVYPPGGDQPVDHFKADNFSLTVYKHTPETVIPGARSGHEVGGGGGKPTGKGGSTVELQLVGKGDGSASDLKELTQAYDGNRTDLLKTIQSHGAVEGTARAYQPHEFADLLHLVLERGQPIETLPAAKGIRESVEQHMLGLVVEMQRRYPEEFKKVGKHDPETGEYFDIKGNDGKMKANIPAMYRFSKRLLNAKMGLPIHSEPSARQKELVLGFVEGSLGKKGIADPAKAAEILREEFRNLSPDFKKAYQAANPAMRSALLDAVFDGKRFATFQDRAQAMALVRYLGKSGYHLEFSLTADLSKSPPEYLLALGDLTAAINPRPGLVALVHSHPRLYLNRRRNLMGHRDTLDLDTGREVRHSASILFSPGDLAGMIHDAQKLSKDKVSLPGFIENGVYRNWVQHPFGLSEAEIRVGADGKVAEMKIRYGFYEGQSGLDGSHASVRKEVEAYARKAFPGVKLSFEEVSTAQIEAKIP